MKKTVILLITAFSIISVYAANISKPLDKSPFALSAIPYQIVFESYSNNNWDLHIINADGTGRKNITETQDIHEMYPKVSPDGTRIVFVADKGEGRNRRRDLYLLNLLSGKREMVSEHARQPAWSPDSRYIAFVKSESTRRFSMESWATKGLYFYDTYTGEIKKHPNDKIEHLYNLSYAPGGKYLTATLLGGMGFRHTNIAIDLKSSDFFKLGIIGCRPEFTPDGKKIAWGRSDTEFKIAKIDLTRRPPVDHGNIRSFIKVKKGFEVYHADWSPDGKYIVFAYGPKGNQEVGGMTPGWNICIAEAATGKWVKITNDGSHNKEPDWMPVPGEDK
jgi:Tol biopolymer transport system component